LRQFDPEGDTGANPHVDVDRSKRADVLGPDDLRPSCPRRGRR
jgi:hypothetical protein